MKNLIVILLLALSFNLAAQERWMDRNATIKFESNAEVDDDVRAVNTQVAAIFVPADEKLAFQVLIKGFEFKKALMQEHFNENYMESDKYPKARFSGRIEAFTNLKFEGDKPQTVVVSGELEIRGIKKPLSTEASLVKKNDKFILDAHFLVALKDYGIEIPSLVADKIAKNIDVDVHAELAK